MYSSLFTLVVLFSIAGVSCNRNNAVATSVAMAQSQKALEIDPRIAAIVSTFPKGRVGINGFTGEIGETNWVSLIRLHQRYTLTVTVPLKRDAENKLTPAGPATGVVTEWSRIEPDPTGSVSSYAGQSWNLTARQMVDLCKANGDFNSVGIKLVSDSPVPNFDRFVTQLGG